jgi:hypothetical protein
MNCNHRMPNCLSSTTIISNCGGPVYPTPPVGLSLLPLGKDTGVREDTRERHWIGTHGQTATALVGARFRSRISHAVSPRAFVP